MKKLSLSRLERLAVLLEELGEAQQAIGKIMRHGYEGQHPSGGPNNAALLEMELGDVLAAIDMLVEAGDLDWDQIEDARKTKPARRAPYLHYQKNGSP